MTLPAEDGVEAIERLRARCAELEEENAQLNTINNALMTRVEREMDMQGNSFSLFQAAIALEDKVKERTAALTQALHAIEQTNRELQASNEAANAASRAKSAFLAAMSHELRTPMNGVVGMAEILLTTALDERQQTSAETIRQSALALLRILNDILDFSKIEAGRMTTEAAPFGLRAHTELTLRVLRPQFAAKGLPLSLDWPADLPEHVIGDATRYAQIVTNLVGNALKFTAAGQVTLRARLLREQDGALVFRFEVSDSGIGIRAEALPTLFEAFTQADSSTTREFGGTGLGLAIVRRLCHLMGGDCGVASEVGRGSTFWFTLTMQRGAAEPRRTPLDTPAAKPAAKRTFAARHLNVLVVEDNRINQTVARGFLDTLGCTCTVVDNGQRAVDALTVPHEYDVVLMDCQMPVLDGLEATRRVRAHERAGESTHGTHVPIIALTANAVVGDREACLAAGMDDFLSKPFRIDDLAAMLDARCPRPVEDPVT